MDACRQVQPAGQVPPFPAAQVCWRGVQVMPCRGDLPMFERIARAEHAWRSKPGEGHLFPRRAQPFRRCRPLCLFLRSVLLGLCEPRCLVRPLARRHLIPAGLRCSNRFPRAGHHAQPKRRHHRRHCRKRHLITSPGLLESVNRARRPGHHRLVVRGAAAGPSPARWPSRSAAPGPSPGTSSRSNPNRRGA